MDKLQYRDCDDVDLGWVEVMNGADPNNNDKVKMQGEVEDNENPLVS